MAKDPHFPFYAQDFLVDTMQLDEHLTGAYIRMLSVMWINGFCLSDANHLAMISSSAPRVAEVLKDKFTFHKDGTMTSNRMEIERAKRLEIREKRSICGSLGVKQKLSKSTSKDITKNQAKDNDNDNDNEKEKKDIKSLSLLEEDQFKQWMKIYPRGVDGVFEGEIECREWFAIHRFDARFPDVISATRRYAASEKASDPKFIKKPINFLNDWKAWMPKPQKMTPIASAPWKPTGLKFGKCQCGGEFIEMASGSKTKVECNKCQSKYVPPPFSAEKAAEQVRSFKLKGTEDGKEKRATDGEADHGSAVPPV